MFNNMKVVNFINITTNFPCTWHVLPAFVDLQHNKNIHLSVNQGSLFCFVRRRSPKPWCFSCALGIFGKLLMSKGALHWLGLRLFRPKVWKLLIIEPFSQWKLNKIETENCIEIWGRSWCCWKAWASQI